MRLGCVLTVGIVGILHFRKFFGGVDVSFLIFFGNGRWGLLLDAVISEMEFLEWEEMGGSRMRGEGRGKRRGEFRIRLSKQGE